MSSRASVFVTEDADHLATYPNRCVEESGNAKRLQVTFHQTGHGRLFQGVISNDWPSFGQRRKIGRTIRKAQPAVLALLMKAFGVAQMEDFTSYGGPIFLQ